MNLKETKAICEAATAAPWKRIEENDAYVWVGSQTGSVARVTRPRIHFHPHHEQAEANVEFIAHARTALPELVEWANDAREALNFAAYVLERKDCFATAKELRKLAAKLEDGK